MGVPSSLTVLSEEEVQTNWNEELLNCRLENKSGGRQRVYLYNVITTGILLHGATIWGIYLLFTGAFKIQSVLLSIYPSSSYYYFLQHLNFQFDYGKYQLGAVLLVYSLLSTTAGSHRLWAHKSYKAKLPLEIFLAIGQTLSSQESIYVWVRNHRVHHKYTETDADPHNAKRGFFYSHMGWLFVSKHEDVVKKGKHLDFSDLKKNRLVMWQHKYYWGIWMVMVIILPQMFFQQVMGEEFQSALFLNWARSCLGLHITFLVNSVAHLYGYKPYDKSINPSDNKLVAFYTLGEGWHNYHHVFPWDYKTSELGQYFTNSTTAFIDFCAWLGLAYDLKTVPKEVVQQRINRTGDGCHPRHSHSQSSNDSEAHSNALPSWGWGDKETPKELIQQTQIFRSKKKLL